MDRPPDVLLVLAKSPVAGLAKTRLCPPASPSDAAAIAAAALLDTLDAVAGVPGARVMVAWTGDLAGAQYAAELGRALAGVERFEQSEGPLERRIAGAHAEVARRAPGSAVLQIGMDTPQVDADTLTAALIALRSPDGRVVRAGVAGTEPGGTEPVDAVLGPALDGGWWALGLRDPRRAAAVAEVPMSRSDTGELTRGALLGAGLRVATLATVRDVDDANDAHIVAAEAPHGRFAAQVHARLRPPVGGTC
jgi:glycosyltransferase A (GT-A) superfamily protein (DUF2064 family)